MVRLTSQAPDVQNPRIDPRAGTRLPASRAISGLASDLGSLVNAVASTAPDPSQQRFQLGLIKDRAVAESVVGQLDAAFDTLAQTTDLSPQDIADLKDFQTVNRKLTELRLQKPASTFDNIRRLAKLREAIAKNPIAAPELLSSFGGGGHLDEQIDAMFEDVDAQAEAKRKAIEAHREQLGPRAADWSDSEVEASLQEQINRTRRAELAHQRRQTLQDEFRVANIDTFNQADLEQSRRSTLENQQLQRVIRQSVQLLESEERDIDMSVAAERVQQFIDEFDPQNPDPQFVETTLFEMSQQVADLREAYRRRLGPAGDEKYLDRLMYPFETGLALVEAYAQGKMSKNSMQSAKDRLELGASLRMYDKFPSLPEVGVIAETFGELFPKDWLTNFQLHTTLEPLLMPMLNELGRSATEAAEEGGQGPDNLIDGAASVGMNRSEAMRALRNYSTFLRRGLTSPRHSEEDKQELVNALRAALRSPNHGMFGGFFAQPVDVEAMNLILPLMADESIMARVQSDPELTDQLLTNYEVYSTELASSIKEDLDSILGTKVNIENIPDILGLRSDVPRAGEFIDVRIGGEDASTIITELGYRTKITENGTVLITPRTDRELKIKNKDALKFLRSMDKYLTTWRESYQDKIRYSAQFLSRHTDLTPKQVAEALLSGQNPLDIDLDSDLNAQPQSEAQ